MTIDGFLPVAVIIGGAVVGVILVYTIFYSLHLKALGKLGAWWAWPLLTFYAVCAVISLGCAIVAFLEIGGPRYGFYGDDPFLHEYAHFGPRPAFSFLFLFVISCLLFLSARHAVTTTRSAKAKS